MAEFFSWEYPTPAARRRDDGEWEAVSTGRSSNEGLEAWRATPRGGFELKERSDGGWPTERGVESPEQVAVKAAVPASEPADGPVTSSKKPSVMEQLEAMRHRRRDRRRSGGSKGGKSGSGSAEKPPPDVAQQQQQQQQQPPAELRTREARAADKAASRLVAANALTPCTAQIVHEAARAGAAAALKKPSKMGAYRASLSTSASSADPSDSFTAATTPPTADADAAEEDDDDDEEKENVVSASARDLNVSLEECMAQPVHAGKDLYRHAGKPKRGRKDKSKKERRSKQPPREILV